MTRRTKVALLVSTGVFMASLDLFTDKVMGQFERAATPA